MDGNFDHPYAWNGLQKIPGGKRFMESQLMDNGPMFCKTFYDQHKAEQKRKQHS